LAATGIGAEFIRKSIAREAKKGKLPFNRLVQFVSMPKFIGTETRIYQRSENVANEASDEVVRLTRRIKEVSLLILDDYGAESGTEAIKERMLDIVDFRWSQRKATTVYTSNLSLDALEWTAGKRIRSRVEGGSIAIHFCGKDHRRTH
jgi:DNA replication protein DnaC